MIVADQVWVSIPNNTNKAYSNIDASLTAAGNTLSIATNAITTMMIAYRLWYVATGGIHWIQQLTTN